MAGMGAGYDLSVATFSPDGRVFQVEYASKAVDNGSTCVAFACKDGVVLGTEKYVLTKMVMPHSSPRIFAIDDHAAMVVTGFVADGRNLVERARYEALTYRFNFDKPIPGKVLSERLALFVHAFTLEWSVRPFGAGVLLGVVEPAPQIVSDEEMESSQPQDIKGERPMVLNVYCIDPAGTCYKYFGTAIGKGRQAAKTELEKLTLGELTCREALWHVSRILREANEEVRERETIIEMSWICAESDWRVQKVSDELIREADERAQKHMEERVQ